MPVKPSINKICKISTPSSLICSSASEDWKNYIENEQVKVDVENRKVRLALSKPSDLCGSLIAAGAGRIKLSITFLNRCFVVREIKYKIRGSD